MSKLPSPDTHGGDVMTKKQRTILLAVLATVVAIVIVVVGAGVWIFTSLVENEAMNETEANTDARRGSRALQRRDAGDRVAANRRHPLAEAA